MKKCPRCGKEKNESEFYKINRGKGELYCYCKQCSKELACASHAKLYKINPEKYLEKSRIFREKFPEKHKQSLKNWRVNLRLEVLNHYSNNNPKCTCCGEKELKFLSLDHIKGGGDEDRKKRGWGNAFYNSIKKSGYPEGLQVLCHNCNLAKEFYGSCPHQDKK